MNRFADSAQTPEFDAPQIVRRTRRRRTVGIAAVAAALIAAGGGTALATSVSGNTSTTAATRTAADSSTSAAANMDATTLLYRFSDGQTVANPLGGMSLDMAETVLEKTQTKLGTVTKKTVKGCKPGSVIGVSPHAPTSVKAGDTVNFTVCAG
ncbi:PASTA domain-containing protein [Streptomyces rishiriensis]|uniref:PASTA domain-containing protein n=1 Tax=Streptomyces rishiriensis TaxID=68264 RepID=UPI0037917380